MQDNAGQQTRERILACAEDLFGRKGYDAVSVADIAHACDVSTALIYYHFTDKESVLKALIDHASEVFDVHVREAVEGTGSARERLERFIVGWLESAESHVSLLRILVRPLTDPEGPLAVELLARIGRTIAALASVIAEGVESGEFAPMEPSRAAEGLLGLVNTRAAADVLNVPANADHHASAELVTRLFFSGITR
jgi:AcrR family transcriptional regulator